MTKTPKRGDKPHVALLRGINVGGKNILPMKTLVEIFEDAECAEVRSYIQSGNVIFRCSTTLAHELPKLIAAEIEERFGYQIPIVLRTGVAISRIANKNPFLKARGVDPKTLHVGFLSGHPTRAKVSSLDPSRSTTDRFELKGGEIYLHCPNGLARSKLTNRYFDTTLKKTSTFRNWRTVLKLVDLCQTK